MFKTNMTETQSGNRTSLLKIISCLCYLARQGLPFRGHGNVELRFGLDRAKLLGQCYDGCNTMIGKKKGAATLIKRDVQVLALTTHCYAHSLNLACRDWIKNSTVVSNSLDTSYETKKLVKFSPKRDPRLRKIQEEEYYENEEKLTGKMQTMRLFSQTRWTVRASSLTSICENYKELNEL